ncbi:MAG: TGS domain-containing protein [candidate division WOR-3 bacterium]|nr:MAG: TGS domain-containing protein [candidate division WOR-3 bacterium]
MPANLSPEYKEAETRYRAAKTAEERLACLEEMLSTIPKHKGTEKMQADIKTRIAKVRKSLGQKKGAKRADWFHVDKQGAGQVAVLGAPNSGKSALVAHLTGLPAQVTAYPFATTMPAAGMMPYQDIQIQLVDTPPLARETPPWVFHILRTSDMLLWTIDLSDDALLEALEETSGLLDKARIMTDPGEDPARLKKTLRVGTKCDDPQAADRLAILKEMEGELEILPVSVQTGQGLEEMKLRLFQALGIIRVYTKKPGKPADMDDPVILRAGATVIDAAFHLHKDIAARLCFARLWNDHGCDGQRVERAHVVEDQDIVEFHS